MNVCRNARLAAAVLAAAALTLTTASRAAAQPDFKPPTNHSIALSAIQVSVVDRTHLVISGVADGDIRGGFTFDVRATEGAGWSGSWLLVSSYQQDVDVLGIPLATPPEDHDGEPGVSRERDHNHDHEGQHAAERTVAVRNGSVIGAVAGLTLSTTDAGTPAGATSPLTVTSGTLTFTGATGNGTVTLTNLNDPLKAAGSLSLFF